MRAKKHLTGLALLGLGVAVSLGATAPAGGTTTTSPGWQPPPSTTTTFGGQRPPSAAIPAAASTTVKVEGSCGSQFYCFSPATVTVSVGDTVAWSNVSDAGHTVTRCTPAQCDGVGPGTGTDSLTQIDLPFDGNGSHTFTGAGTYNYFCVIHGYAIMHGTITVQAPASTTTSAPSNPTTPAPGGNGASAGTSRSGTAAASAAATAGATPTTVAAGDATSLASTGSSALPYVLGAALVALGLALAIVRRPRRDDTLRG